MSFAAHLIPFPFGKDDRPTTDEQHRVPRGEAGPPATSRSEEVRVDCAVGTREYVSALIAERARVLSVGLGADRFCVLVNVGRPL